MQRRVKYVESGKDPGCRYRCTREDEAQIPAQGRAGKDSMQGYVDEAEHAKWLRIWYRFSETGYEV